MSENSADRPTTTMGLFSKPLTRRGALATGLAAAGALLLPAPRGNAEPLDPERDYLDVSKPEVLAGSNWLRLTLDESAPAGTAQGVPLALGTTQGGPISLTIASATGLTALRTERLDDQPSGHATVRVAPGQRAVVWVVPQRVGSAEVPADRLIVSTPHGDMTVDAWVEPVGGRWRMLGAPGGDLGICAVNAALLRTTGSGNDTQVLMYSPPRTRRWPGGPPLPNPTRGGDKWVWSVYTMNDIESRTLDMRTLAVTDSPWEIPGRFGGTPKKNIFCSGFAHLPDGRLLVAGGHIWESGDSNQGNNGGDLFIYDPRNEPGWTRLASAPLEPHRWYPTVTALPDGRMLISSGSRDAFRNDAAFYPSINNDYRIFDPTTNRMVDNGNVTLIDPGVFAADPRKLGTYPGVFVLPGRNNTDTVLAMVETNRGWLYDYRTGQPLQRAANYYQMNSHGSRSYPTSGTAVLLPFQSGTRQTKILALGGHDENDAGRISRDDPTAPCTRTAEIFDVDTNRALTQQSGWRKVGDMKYPRILCDATLLADGTVLVSGGSENGWADRNENRILESELFDPATERFRTAALAATDRRYHSTALLQLDGTVLKAGSTGGFAEAGEDAAKWIRSRTDAEVYEPGYLFRGQRPLIDQVSIRSGPALGYDYDFAMTVRGSNLDANSRVGVIRLGAVTHGIDMDQRFVWLTVTGRGQMANSGIWHLFVKSPASPATAPPGDYQLVVVDNLGVPSRGTAVRLAA